MYRHQCAERRLRCRWAGHGQRAQPGAGQEQRQRQRDRWRPTTYTLTVSNSGNVATSGTITVVDVLPAGMTIAAGAVTLGGAQAANWSCTAAGQNITCTSATAIAAAGNSIFSFTPGISAGTTGTLTNPAKVGGGGDPTNPAAPTPATAGVCTGTNVPSEGCAVDGPDTVNAPSLGLAKSNGSASVTAGGTTTYTLTVSNSGNVATSGTITVVDVLPAGMTIAAGAVTLGGAQAANWSCTAAGQNITCTSATAIAAAGNSIFSFTPGISAGTTGTLTNPAKVGGGGDPTNPAAPTPATAGVCTGTNVPSEGCAVDGPDTVNPTPVLTKSFGANPQTIGVGQTTTLTFTVDNSAAGAVNRTALGFTDTLTGAGSLIATASTPQCGGGNVTVTGGNVISINNAAVNAGTTCTITVSITGVTAGIYVNGPTNSSISGVSANLSNNVTDQTLNVQRANVGKTFAAASITDGASTSLIFTLFNTGTNPVQSGISVSDTLPAGLRLTSAIPAVSYSVGCSGPATAAYAFPTRILSGLTGLAMANGTASCTVTLAGVTNTAGQIGTCPVAAQTNLATSVTTTGATNASADQCLSVTKTNPGVAKTFGAASITDGPAPASSSP
ncbi:MAG: DUF11 domain-containing protein [Betaproteobacteria bacterium]|nr:DUF11 domain-containing protein [Betaproteobacteria bacterium]